MCCLLSWAGQTLRDAETPCAVASSIVCRSVVMQMLSQWGTSTYRYLHGVNTT
jgi:hypothetical protein